MNDHPSTIKTEASFSLSLAHAHTKGIFRFFLLLLLSFLFDFACVRYNVSDSLIHFVQSIISLANTTTITMTSSKASTLLFVLTVLVAQHTTQAMVSDLPMLYGLSYYNDEQEQQPQHDDEESPSSSSLNKNHSWSSTVSTTEEYYHETSTKNEQGNPKYVLNMVVQAPAMKPEEEEERRRRNDYLYYEQEQQERATHRVLTSTIVSFNPSTEQKPVLTPKTAAFHEPPTVDVHVDDADDDVTADARTPSCIDSSHYYSTSTIKLVPCSSRSRSPSYPDEYRISSSRW